jgi:endonuclease V-like protein UPF0215 family
MANLFPPKTQVPVVGVVFRGCKWIEGVLSTNITVDGLDATEKIGAMLQASGHYRQIRVIMLNGVTFGGFNVVDINALSKATGLPVIAVTEKKPDLDQVRSALQHLPDFELRWQAILNAGELLA